MRVRAETCAGRCGSFEPLRKCQCDSMCLYYGSCCPDFDQMCPKKTARGDTFEEAEEDRSTLETPVDVLAPSAAPFSSSAPPLTSSAPPLTSERPEPPPAAPPADRDAAACSARPFDAFLQLKNGSVYAFRGHYFFELDDKAVLPGYPKRIEDVWGVTGPVDAAFTRINCQGKSYIFQGRKYWRFDGDVLDEGFPRDISEGFDGIPDDLHAAFAVPAPNHRQKEKAYFFKGDRYHVYEFVNQPSHHDLDDLFGALFGAAGQTRAPRRAGAGRPLPHPSLRPGLQAAASRRGRASSAATGRASAPRWTRPWWGASSSAPNPRRRSRRRSPGGETRAGGGSPAGSSDAGKVAKRCSTTSGATCSTTVKRRGRMSPPRRRCEGKRPPARPFNTSTSSREVGRRKRAGAYVAACRDAPPIRPQISTTGWTCAANAWRRPRRLTRAPSPSTGWVARRKTLLTPRALRGDEKASIEARRQQTATRLILVRFQALNVSANPEEERANRRARSCRRTARDFRIRRAPCWTNVVLAAEPSK
uniref:Vitronectin-like n=1 Tax=Hippocampus comes TaxID=109280 RepID=A0A3Q2YT93_HIPCM